MIWLGAKEFPKVERFFGSIILKLTNLLFWFLLILPKSTPGHFVLGHFVLGHYAPWHFTPCLLSRIYENILLTVSAVMHVFLWTKIPSAKRIHYSWIKACVFTTSLSSLEILDGWSFDFAEAGGRSAYFLLCENFWIFYQISSVCL